MFESREQAGQLLSKELRKQLRAVDVVLGIPRGGVLVAAEIARSLGVNCAPLVIKKLGLPENPELAIGAVSKNTVYRDELLIQRLHISEDYLQKEIKVKQAECRKRERKLAKFLPPLANKTVVVTDDGVATGATFKAAVKVVEREQPNAIILAIPVVSASTVNSIRQLAKDCIILIEPAEFTAVGQFYLDFHEVNDQEVQQVLESVQKTENKNL